MNTIVFDQECSSDELAGRVIAAYKNLIGDPETDDLRIELMFQLVSNAIGLHRLVFGCVTLDGVSTVLQYDHNSIAEAYNLMWHMTKHSFAEHLEYRRYYRFLINSASMPGSANAVNSLVSLFDLYTQDDVKPTKSCLTL